MKNILAILAIVGCIQLAIMASAQAITNNARPADIQQFNDQDTIKTKRQANPKNKRSSPRESIGVPPDIRTDTGSVPPTPFDTLSNPSGHKRN